ncbi:MAG: disulfide bond formation protein B [Rhodobacteraceae bacterium]|nr:disulfide bond formation protein B [Paracoccaceae bacterium]MAY47106.1 disulfide bond formation protein B [Paracoccaceae bacterium]QEW19908.1 disulfide bond formation protein B [Marinibacterium anthonyi]
MRTTLTLLAALGSAALLLGALGFQYIGGLAPCHLCYLQRYPHAAAVAIGVLALAFRARILCLLGALAAAASGVVGIYHTGVERHWWQGPTTCTSGSVSGLSTDQLMDQILSAPVVQCDQVAWAFLNLSMASWNAIFSFALALLWIAAYNARR